jgi:hypothetical protein
MTGRGYLRQRDAQARIEAQMRGLRRELAGCVIAAVDVAGFRPNGGPMEIAKGTRVRSDDPIVRRYPAHFRPLTAPEVDRIVASWRRRWIAGAGL